MPGIGLGISKVIKGSGLNLNITDAMMEEDVDYYFASEDEADVYLQLVEE